MKNANIEDYSRNSSDMFFISDDFFDVETHKDYPNCRILWNNQGKMYRYIMVPNDFFVSTPRLSSIMEMASVKHILWINVPVEKFPDLVDALLKKPNASPEMLKWLNNTD